MMATRHFANSADRLCYKPVKNYLVFKLKGGLFIKKRGQQAIGLPPLMYNLLINKMKAKFYFLLFVLLASAVFCEAQSPVSVNLYVSERYVAVSAVQIEGVLVFLDAQGNIYPDQRSHNNLDYNSSADWDAPRKLNKINGLNVKYYDRFDRDEPLGKVKYIGTVKFTYYDVFDRDELLGKLKSVGGIPVKYYDVFDRDELIGKLKSVGDAKITYYDRFGSDENIGKFKAITGETPNVNVIFDEDYK